MFSNKLKAITAVSGFRKAGVFLFKPYAVSVMQESSSNADENTTRSDNSADCSDSSFDDAAVQYLDAVAIVVAAAAVQVWMVPAQEMVMKI